MLTFADLLTPEGIAIAGGILTLLVSVIKTYLPFTADWDGMVMAFIASLALYLLAGIATGVSTLDAGLTVFISWLDCLAAAIAAHKIVVKPIVAKVQGG